MTPTSPSPEIINTAGKGLFNSADALKPLPVSEFAFEGSPYGKLDFPTFKHPVAPGQEGNYSPEFGGYSKDRSLFLRPLLMGSLLGAKEGPSDAYMKEISTAPTNEQSDLMRMLSSVQFGRLNAGSQAGQLGAYLGM